MPDLIRLAAHRFGWHTDACRGDTQVGQWDLQATKEHALGVLEAVTVADLDSGYYRTLRGSVGIDEPRARQVIDDLRNWRTT